MPRKSKRKPIEVPGPTPERAAKDDWHDVPTEQAGVRARRVRDPMMVDKMLADERLSPDEHTVCVTYASTYLRAFGCDAQISRYDGNLSLGGRIPAQQHDLAAVRALWRFLGPIQSKWMSDVCVDGFSMREMERALTCRNGTGLAKFRSAIEQTAKHWGIPLDNGDR